MTDIAIEELIKWQHDGLDYHSKEAELSDGVLGGYHARQADRHRAVIKALRELQLVHEEAKQTKGGE